MVPPFYVAYRILPCQLISIHWPIRSLCEGEIELLNDAPISRHLTSEASAFLDDAAYEALSVSIFLQRETKVSASKLPSSRRGSLAPQASLL